jgi:hypothetical protein
VGAGTFGAGTVGGAASCAWSAAVGHASMVPAIRSADSWVRARIFCEATLFIPQK